MCEGCAEIGNDDVDDDDDDDDGDGDDDDDDDDEDDDDDDNDDGMGGGMGAVGGGGVRRGALPIQNEDPTPQDVWEKYHVHAPKGGKRGREINKKKA